jgi:hypothetical protein
VSAPGFSGNRYLLAINGSGGVFIPVLAKSTVRRLVIKESPITVTGTTQALQGVLDYTLPNDDTAAGFTTIFRAVGGNTETTEGQVITAQIELGSPNTNLSFGEIIGQVGQQIVGLPSVNPATTMIQLRSGTATATTVEVTEYN